MLALCPPERADFEPALQRLRSRPGVDRALLVSADGLLIAGTASNEETVELWGAVSAVLGNLGGSLTACVEGGKLESAVFCADGSRFVVRRVRLGFVLAVAQNDTDLDRLCGDAEQTAADVEVVAAQFLTPGPEGNQHD